MFANKTLIVTGASRGIGRALALALCARGAGLVLGARTETLLDETATQCRSEGKGGGVRAVAGDVSREDTARALVDQALKLEGEDPDREFWGFIHAAGVLHPGPTLWEVDEAGYADILDASLTAAWRLCRAAVPELRRRGRGLCVFFGSGAAEKTQPGIALYCAAKAAEEHLARNLAAEAPELTSFVYRPGIVETRMQEEARAAEGGAAEELKKVFVPWKEQNMLITPARAAAGLIRYLSGDLAALSGRVVDVRDL